MLLSLFLILIIIALLLLLSMIWPPNSPWAPWWRTNKKTARAICELAKIDKNDIIYDLGSGDGTLLITAAKEYGGSGVGTEIDPLRVLVSKLRVKFNNLENKIKIERRDFFKTDLSKATVIVVYLVPNTLEKLLPKFKKELKKGTRIVSYKYELDLKLQSSNPKYQIFLYKI